MKVFHHNDMDGKCSGYWVRKHAENLNKPISCISINYHIPFPFDIIEKDEEIWIVDFSLSVDDMNRLREITPNIIWIDHHKTALEKYKDYPHKIEGLRIDGIAGCELTWIYTKMKQMGLFRSGGEEELFLYHKTTSKKLMIGGEEAPYFTRLIADRDIWKWHYGNDTAYFYLGLSAEDTTPESKIWNFLDETPLYAKLAVKHFIERGQIISQYREQWSKEYRDEWAFEVGFAGYKCLAMNIAKSGSEAFGKENVETYDIVIPFVLGKDGRWHLSLYSTKSYIDVSEIAKKYSGGGHKGAAGFSTPVLPWTLNFALQEKV